jgi:hypothetical protein
LAEKHRAVRDLHVVTELEVAGKLQSLGHGNVTPGLEHHHRNWTAREGIAYDKLGDDIKTDLLVGDSLNDADRDSVRER